MPSARPCAYACVASAQHRCAGKAFTHVPQRRQCVIVSHIWKGCRVDPLTASCERLYKRPKVLRFLAINFQCHVFLFHAIYIAGLDRAVCGLCLYIFCLHSCSFLSFSWLASLYSCTLIHGCLEVNYLSFSSIQKHLQLIKVSLSSSEPGLTFQPSA